MPLLLAALWLRALVPAGWMPVASADGVVLTLCSGDTVRHDSHGPVSPGHEAPCAFAGIAPLLAAAAPAIMPPALLALVVPARLGDPGVRIAPPRAARPPPQGPPILPTA